VERNHISSLESHGKVLEKECCLPGVFCDSGDMPASLLCELNGHLMPCASCLYGRWVEDVWNLEYLFILFCAVLWAAAPGFVAVLPVWDSAYLLSCLALSQAIGFQLLLLSLLPATNMVWCRGWTLLMLLCIVVTATRHWRRAGLILVTDTLLGGAACRWTAAEASLWSHLVQSFTVDLLLRWC